MRRNIICIFAAIVAAICSATSLRAQDMMDVAERDADNAAIIDIGGSTELSVSYGALPAMRWITAYTSDWKEMDPWGAVVVSIDHRFAPRVWAGLSYTISSASSGKATPRSAEGSITWHALLVHCRYIYGWADRWTFYGALGAGVIVSYMQPSGSPTYNQTKLGFQATPIGTQFRVLDNFDIFAEAGFGVQGIVKAGVRVDF